MTLKISISGVRGLVPGALTPEVCLEFAKAFGSYLLEASSNKLVAVGTDPRSSSEFIKGIIFSGLLSTGCQVVDLGICPTPTVGIMVRELKAAGGIIITASHNPLPWNGLKFMRRDGIFLNENEARQLIDIYTKKIFKKETPGNVISDPSGIDLHIRKIVKLINVRAIRRKNFRVAIDCCNGAGSVICPKLLEKLSCKVEAINCRPSLPFPHPPEPVAENLQELIELVRNKKADIGFALDSDADRLAIVSEQGRPIGEEMTLALAVKHILSDRRNGRPGKKIVITNLSTTKAIDDIVREHRGMVIRTKIGEVHVAEEIKHLGALIGGEGNGGVIYPPLGYNRDAIAAMTIILSLMAASGKEISELLSEIPAYYMVKKKIKCKNQEKAEQFIGKVKDKFRGRDLILTEGVKVMFNSSWLHVRASNTEPVIRIIAEGKEKKEAKNLIDKVLKPRG